MLRHGRMLLATVLLAVSTPALGAFQDVLDTPASVTPLAQRTLLLGVARAENRLVAVGPRGHILTSDDQGGHWVQAAVPVSSDLTAVWFANGRRGWAVGHDGVVLTTLDGGSTWSKQMDGREAGRRLLQYCEKSGDAALIAEAGKIAEDGPDKPFLDVWFADDRTGYIVGAFNMAFKTTDSGENWTPLFDRIDNPQRLHLYAIRPAGDDLFIVGEGGLVLKASAGSDRFKAVAFPYNGSLFGLLADGNAVLVYGLRGHMFRSADGGASWLQIETRERSALVGGTAGASGRLTVVAQGGAVLQSNDQGQHFAPLAGQRPMPLTAVTEDRDGKLVVVGFAGARRVQAEEPVK